MKVLIVGGAGMLGHKVWLAFRDRFETYVTLRGSFQRVAPLRLFDEEKTFCNVDAGNLPSMETVLEKVEPDVVVNCVGIIKQLPEAHEEKISIQINSLFPHALAEIADRFGAKVIHMSTDCVFSGEKGNYSEVDVSDATDLYGRTKFLGEIQCPPHLTIRSSIIGRDFFHHLGLLEWFLSRSPKEKIKGFTRAIYTGFTTGAMADILAFIIEKHPDLSGLFQVASQPIDKHGLLKMLQKEFHLDMEIVPFEDFRSDRSLNGNRFRQETGFTPPTWEEMVQGLVEEDAFYRERTNAVGR